jgi:hypothetical protein
MLEYSKLSSLKSPTFGKLECISKNTCPTIAHFSIVWCTETGASYSRRVNVSAGSCSSTSEFTCNQTKHSLEYTSLQSKLSETPGYYYSAQLGGSSSSYLLMKLPVAGEAGEASAEYDDAHIRWNALHFLHKIGWIEYTGSAVKQQHVLGVAMHVERCLVPWVSAKERAARIAAVPAIDIHWVWFRRAGYRLTQEIVERAYSWIALNPDCRFHLWTDIPTRADVDDFMSLIEPEWRDAFMKTVNVHLRDDTYRVIEDAFKCIESANPEVHEGMRLLRAEFDSIEKQSRVYKTDFVRLFILGVVGGVYADFNDCVCLAPVRDIIAIYGYDIPLGVSDLYDINHASNYFMYCPPPASSHGNVYWNNIIADMIVHVPHIIGLIRNNELRDALRSYIERAIRGLASESVETMDISELAKIYGRRELPHCGNEHLDINMWNRFVWVIVGEIASAVGGGELRVKIQPRMEYSKNPGRARGGRRGAAPAAFIVIDNATIDAMLAYISDDSVYNQLFLFWWTDYNLRVLMHYTNLPIFCRMRNIPLVFLPFGYMLIYSCALSWVGHIGDGTSYGMDGRKDNIRIRNLINGV